MDKPAQTEHEMHELLRQRWSPRAFSARPIEVDTVRSLLEAARWAPSSMNEQPWRFIVALAGDGDGHARLLDTLMPGNRVWAERAPLLIAAVARTTFQRNGKANRHALHDVGQAVALLSVQATAAGLGVHQMGGFDREALSAAFGIPDGFDPVSVVAVGYPGEPEELSDELAERERSPRSRAAQSELVFAERWQQPW